jgi:hypothetical protein
MFTVYKATVFLVKGLYFFSGFKDIKQHSGGLSGVLVSSVFQGRAVLGHPGTQCCSSALELE